jgi:hypothetical protein
LSAAKISFGIIVLNGEPFIRANLRALYPYAHQIIVVEGASPHAAESATADGHSRDHTLRIVREFSQQEDPEGKVTLITAEDEGHPNGFWPREKTQQSQAYANRATGDWLWQIDVDEFYAPADMKRMARFLSRGQEVSCITFGAYHFFGGSDFLVDGGFFWHPQYQGECYGRYRRIFRWKQGWYYASHRPPTIYDNTGRDVTRDRIVDGASILGRREVIFHYFMPTPEVILRKARYYSRIAPAVFSGREQASSYLLQNLNPEACLRVFDQYGTWNWIAAFDGEHPPEVAKLIAAGELNDPRLSRGFAKVVTDSGYRARVAFLWLREVCRSHLNAAWYSFKMALIGRAPALPASMWRVLPSRWQVYREPTWRLERWCAEEVAVLRASRGRPCGDRGANVDNLPIG